MSTDKHTRTDRYNAGCPRRIELIRSLDPASGDERTRAVRKHAAGCPRCTEIIASLEDGRREFLANHPSEAVVPRLLERAAGSCRRRRLALVAAPAAVLLATIVVLVAWPVNHHPRPGATRVKGGVSLRFFVQRGRRSVEARSGQVFHAGDRIQFVYSSGAKRYLFMVSLDDEGRVSNFNYKGSQRSVPIVPGNGQVLAGSIILDDNKGPERVYAVFSDRPLELPEIEHAAKLAFERLRHKGGKLSDLSRLPLPQPQASILLEKK